MLRQALIEGADLDYFTSKHPNVSSFQFDEVVDQNTAAETINMHQKMFHNLQASLECHYHQQ